MEMTQGKIEEIPVKSIQGNNALAISVGRQELERCERAIREYGLVNPLVVRKCELGHYHVVAGECERMILLKTSQTKTQAVVMEGLGELEAKRLALLLLSLKQSTNALSEGLLLKELFHSGKHTQTEIALMVGRSVSWVNKRLALTERLATSVVDLVKERQLCSHTAQEIARMPRDVQQTFANKVVTEHLAKSVVEKLVRTYNNHKTPQEVKKLVLENPLATLSMMAEEEKPRGSKPKEEMDSKSISLQKLRNALVYLFRLTGEAEGLLATLSVQDKQTLTPLLLQCAQTLGRFARLAKISCEKPDFSPGKNQTEEVI